VAATPAPAASTQPSSAPDQSGVSAASQSSRPLTSEESCGAFGCLLPTIGRGILSVASDGADAAVTATGAPSGLHLAALIGLLAVFLLAVTLRRARSRY
jgi:hypothetical protein